MGEIGLREVVIENLRELLDDEMKKKITFDQLDIERHSLSSLKSWFKNIVLRFINYVGNESSTISSHYIWTSSMENQLYR